MTLFQQKLNISGLVVIAALLILSMNVKHSPSIKFIPPEKAPKATALFRDFSGSTGMINGTVTLPAKSKAKQVSVCAVNDDNHGLYCATKINQSFNLTVPSGTYTVFTTLEANPYNLSSYRAYFTDPGSHTPKKITVAAGQIVTEVTPNDWDNKGDDRIIALLNEQQKTYQRYLAYLKAKQDAQTTTPTPTEPASNTNTASSNTNLDVGGLPTSEQQSVDSTQTAQSH